MKAYYEEIYYKHDHPKFIKVVLDFDPIRLKKIQLFEYLTIILMILIFFTGMLSNLSINKTLDAYAHKNIFAKTLKFSNRSTDIEDISLLASSIKNKTDANLVHQLAVKTLRSILEGRSQDINKTLDSSNATILDSSNTTSIDSSNVTGNPNTTEPLCNQTSMYDHEFLEYMQVNLHAITTRNKALQEYLVFYPLMTLIVATSWCALLICFRSGGYGNNEWLTIGPWRIVIPSIACFLLMLISSIIYAFISNKYINRLCTNLASELKCPERYSCNYLIQQLAPIAPFHVLPTHMQFAIFRITIKIDIVLWFLALCLMSVRWLIAVDFELVKIKLSPYGNDNDKTKDTNSDDIYEDPTTTMITTITETGKEPSLKQQLRDDNDGGRISGGGSGNGVGLNVNDVENKDKEFETRKSLTDSKDDLDDYQSAHSQLTSINDINSTSNGNGQEFSSLEPLIHQQRRPSKDDDNNSEITIKVESAL